ncbi:MAG: tetratricopeptide repeat protein [Ginsengibacter sp.]
MNKILLGLTFSLLTVMTSAQDVSELHANAKAFMQQKDYANATLILVRAIKMEPNNLALAKDLAFNYYLQNEHDKATKVLSPFFDRNTADDQAYQIGGLIYKVTGNFKEADKLFKKGLKSFPQSGPLYNDYGELLWMQQDFSAIKIWEKGIQEDPAFGTNYYNAAKYYYLSKDKIWSIIYGEIFLNVESFTARSAEMKNILLESYKKLFADADLLADTKDKNEFEIAFLSTMNKQNSIVHRGIGVESLTMIRTRFILDWNTNYRKKFPFYLFEVQNKFLAEGMFPAYNQWLFGSVQNLSAYQNWVNLNKEENNAFTSFQKANFFRMPPGQYYH